MVMAILSAFSGNDDNDPRDNKPSHSARRVTESPASTEAPVLAVSLRQLALPKQAGAQPRSAVEQFELGRALLAAQDWNTAIAAFGRAVELNPDLAVGWSAMADAMRMLGNNADADRAYLTSVRVSTRDPELAVAALALSDGRLAEAEPVLRARLKTNPTDIASIRMLAELAVRIERLDDAVTLLRRALTLSPSFDAARELLARTLIRQNRPAEALVEADALLAHDPANPSHAMLRASTLVRIGDQVGAVAVYEDVLGRHPNQPKGWMSFGHVLKALGQQADAIHAYRQALHQQPTLGEAWWSLANLKTIRFSDHDVAAMRAALAIVGASEDDRLHLRFALAKALEDSGENAAAFEHYLEGNRLRRKQLDYSAEDTHERCQRQQLLFSTTFLRARSATGCSAADPIFIVGLPRSGSTLIEQILASHSMVEGTSELPDMMAIAARLARDGTVAGSGRYPELLEDLNPAMFRTLGEEYLERTRVYRRTDRPFFIDKMPNNWMHTGLIRLLLPNARIIDARRHPMGCCLSAWKQHFARGQGFSYDLADVGRYYRDYVEWMAHCDRVMPGAVHRVIYERMVADTEGEVRRLLAYLGIPFEADCLEFWRNDRAVRTASSEQVRQPIFTDAIDHWRRFEPWLDPLKHALGPALHDYGCVA